jgi:hypothetical protein
MVLEVPLMSSVLFDGVAGRAATIERQAREVIARCISILVAYHNGERTPDATAMMATKVQAVAIWVDELDLSVDETDEQVLRPVEAELLARYGHEAGVRISREFLDAFESVYYGDPNDSLE